MLHKMNEAREVADDVLELPAWAKWPGPGPVPSKWWAINPATKERTLVYRSYSDYCD